MDKKRLILMGALAVVGVIVFTQAQKLAQNTSEPTAAPIVEVEQVEYQDILAASADIPFGGRLSSANIKWKQCELAMILRPLGTNGSGAATSRAKFSQGNTKRDRLVVYRAGEQSSVAIINK